VALPSALALKVAAALAVAFAVGAADRQAAPRAPGIRDVLELRSAVAVARTDGNRWMVERSRTAQLLPPWGPGFEVTCRRVYAFRGRHWTDRGCKTAPLTRRPRT
jgi:hypothetical protein